MKQVQEQEQNQIDHERFQCATTWLAGDDLREPAPLAETRAGKFPNASTLRAEVLAVLLASEDMAGMESAFAGAHRLSTVIRALTRRYDWTIERREFSTNTMDGRAVWVTAYSLPPETIAKELELGAAAWIEEVRSARANRRQQASC
jgi:hypothetical protein